MFGVIVIYLWHADAAACHVACSLGAITTVIGCTAHITSDDCGLRWDTLSRSIASAGSFRGVFAALQAVCVAADCQQPTLLIQISCNGPLFETAVAAAVNTGDLAPGEACFAAPRRQHGCRTPRKESAGQSERIAAGSSQDVLISVPFLASAWSGRRIGASGGIRLRE